MRTSAWVVTLLAVGGCTSNQIFLETATDGETGETSDGTDTAPPADSGSDEGPPPECVDDWDCGECGSCNAGVCEDFGGCCSAEPDSPLQWRCSPPEECWEDLDCGVGMICDFGYCVPGPGTQIQEPPACRGDFALEVQQLVLEAPLSHVTLAGPGNVRAIDQDLGLVALDLAVGPVPPAAPLAGDEALQLLGTSLATALAITERSTEGAIEHQLTAAARDGDAWSTSPSGWILGSSQTAAWSEESQELWVAVDARVDRWAFAAPAALELGSIGSLELGQSAVALTPVQPPSAVAPLVAATLADGTVRLLDPVTGETMLATGQLLGQPIDLVARGTEFVAEGAQLVAASHATPEQTGLDTDMTAIHLVPLDGTGGALAPFGAPGTPLEIAVAEIDGDGVDDIIVANADGRLDIYLMRDDYPFCRLFVPLGPILDIEAGDVDGDGSRDVLVVDAWPTVTAIHGAAP